MGNHELIIILTTTSIISFAYLWFYPKVKAFDLNKLSLYDLMSSGIALSVSAVLFWNSNISFNLYFTTTNWFWFTIVVYFIVELPFIFWYMQKYDIWKF